MTKTVVHVTTIEEWKSVLDVWFNQGYEWFTGGRGYEARFFEKGGIYLFLGNSITWDRYTQDMYIEYAEFMAQQKEDNKMATYYVTQEQLDLIELAKGLSYPLTGITAPENLQKEFDKTHFDNEKEILRYIGGDETVEFKVKARVYRLRRIDNEGDEVYMSFDSYGTPDWTIYKGIAFTAPLDEIKKWKTPAWDIEKAD